MNVSNTIPVIIYIILNSGLLHLKYGNTLRRNGTAQSLKIEPKVEKKNTVGAPIINIARIKLYLCD